MNAAAGEYMLKAIQDGAVELYYNNSKKFETTSGGATVTGSLIASSNVEAQNNMHVGDSKKYLAGNSNDLQIYHSSNHSYIKNSTNWLRIGSNYLALKNDAFDEDYLTAEQNGSVELYYDNSKKFETTSTGVQVTGNIDIDGNIDAADDSKIKLGTGDDFQIYHDGSNNYIKSNTGDLVIQHGSENLMQLKDDGAVQLYYDNSLKFETSSDGTKFSGSALFPDDQRLKIGGDASSPDLQIWHDGTDSHIKNSTGNFYFEQAYFRVRNAANTEHLITASENGNVQLYYDNSKKFETTSYGVAFVDEAKFDNDTNAGRDVIWDPANDQMRWLDNTKAAFGNGSDLQIFHNGTDSVIYNGTGSLDLRSNGSIELESADTSEKFAKFIKDGAVELYYDNSKKFETTASGVTVTGTVSDSKGNLRSIPQNTQGSAYTLVNSDGGKHILASGNITWIDGRHSAGDAVTIINNTAGNITITKGTTMYNTADGNNANRTLATRGMATILWASGTVAYISGSGLT